MAALRSSLARHYPSQPANTLMFVEADDVKTATERERKTEKSVRFADTEFLTDDESVDSLQTSKDVITWLPSEHLYSEDTFISETPSGKNTTEPSYGTNTFIDLESEDETKTVSEYSYTDSFASSDVFSSKSQSDSITYREWKDVTEIVKDIEELEESEFVTGADLRAFGEEDDTDATISEDDEMVEEARQRFLQQTIRILKLRDVQSPRSLAMDSVSHSTESPRLLGPASKDKAAFCEKMIGTCLKNQNRPLQAAPAPSELHEKAMKAKTSHVLEYYGLSSTILEKLKLENLQHKLHKKMADIDKETEASHQYLQNNQHIEEEFQKQQFISKMAAQVQNENSEERIQAHLIKMHPINWFAHFINDLPRLDEDSREILYKYKCQIERRKQDSNS